MKSQLKITKSELLAEVTVAYKSKIAKADRISVRKSECLYKYLLSVWNEDKLEHMEEVKIIMLNRANEILGWASISSGGLNGVIMDKKVIFQHALLCNASAIVLAHNHPSGNLKPSYEDIDVTKKIVQAGLIIDIDVLDHIIMTANGYTSFSDDGYI